MRRRRIIVAFQAVETTPMRQFRQVMTGVWDGTRRRRFDTFWCAADRPTTDDSALGLMVAPVYPGTRVPEDARCVECGFRIRDLQREISPLNRGATAPREENHE